MDYHLLSSQVLIAGLEKQRLLEEQPKGYYNTSRWAFVVVIENV